ncbi:MAG: sugar O-acyltransferase (sialic acid O-acetyltransferase NeuD family) [Psychroserpens sp.]|jgi:sugar O-acyltransferase (sialic acid O-acetyltransferase NeuD family)
MSKPSLILIGAGGHARACIDVIEHADTFKIAGLIGTNEELKCESIGYPVIATDSDLPQLAKQYQYALITVGQIESPHIRQHLYDQILALGFKLPAIISPTAHLSRHAEVGNATIVMHGAIVNAGAKVGNNCIINTNALIEHDTTVADHCHISTGAIVNGAANIGFGSFVGSGSIIKQGITLGSHCVVGMGVSVRHHHEKNSRIFTSNNP